MGNILVRDIFTNENRIDGIYKLSTGAWYLDKDLDQAFIKEQEEMSKQNKYLGALTFIGKLDNDNVFPLGKIISLNAKDRSVEIEPFYSCDLSDLLIYDENYSKLPYHPAFAGKTDTVTKQITITQFRFIYNIYLNPSAEIIKAFEEYKKMISIDKKTLKLFETLSRKDNK